MKRLKHTLKRAVKLEGKVAKAAIAPTHKNVKSAKHEAKEVTRNIARSGAKPLVYATGAVTAVASYFGTPVAGAVVGTALSSANYYVGSTAARAKGLHGRAARHAGRVERKKSANAALIGLSIGGAAATIGTAIAGSAASAGVGSAATAVVGPGATSTLSSVGGTLVGAGIKIGQSVITYQQQKAGAASVSASSGTGISLGLGNGSTPTQTTQEPTGKSPWALIALGGAGLMAAVAS